MSKEKTYQSWIACPACELRRFYYDEQDRYGDTVLIVCRCGAVLSFTMTQLEDDKSGGPFVPMPVMRILRLPPAAE